jgi:hypothetical protein
MSDDIRRRGLVADLGRRLAMRNLDELRVIDALLVRVEKGAAHYGPLDLSRPRDWQRERSEELLDALVYDVMGQLAARDRRALAYVVDRNRDHNRAQARAEAEAWVRQPNAQRAWVRISRR